MARPVSSLPDRDSDEPNDGDSDGDYSDESSMEDDGSVMIEEIGDSDGERLDVSSHEEEEEEEDDDTSLHDDDDDDTYSDIDRNVSDKVCFKAQEWKDISASESDASSSSDNEQSNTTQHSNPGWAKTMQRILSMDKPSGKKSVILSKAEKMSKVLAVQNSIEKKDDFGFEIIGGVKEEKDAKVGIEDLDIKPKHLDLVEKKVKPSLLHREREKKLHKIATKGVVQLFNAVRNQQKEIKRKMNAAGGRVRKEEKVLKSLDKRSFVNMLMGNTESTKADQIIPPKNEKEEIKSEESSDWSVLRENFMTGGNFKDWDKSGDAKEELTELI